MADTHAAQLRRLWLNVHLWIGVGLAVLLVPISLSGALLVWHDEIDAWINPHRYAVSGAEVAHAPMSPPRGGLGGQIAQHTTLTADRAVGIARKSEPNAEPTALFLPVQQRGEASLNWRVEMKGRDNTFTVTVDDQSGQTKAIAPQSGDRAAAWIRWIHEGSHSGPLWAAIVFLTGIFPTIFAVTGIMMWLRKRSEARNARSAEAQLRPAE